MFLVLKPIGNHRRVLSRGMCWFALEKIIFTLIAKWKLEEPKVRCQGDQLAGDGPQERGDVPGTWKGESDSSYRKEESLFSSKTFRRWGVSLPGMEKR